MQPKLKEIEAFSTFLRFPSPLGSWLGFSLALGCLGFRFEGSFCLCRFFFPVFSSPAPLGVRNRPYVLVFWALFLSWSALVRCGGDNQTLLFKIFSYYSDVFSFLFFSSGSDNTRGQDISGNDTSNDLETEAVNRKKTKYFEELTKTWKKKKNRFLDALD